MKKSALSLFIIFLFNLNAFPEKMRIAIMDFKGDGVAESMARRITELIRSEMINTGSYIVIERSSMDTILKEQSFQQAGCTDVSCAVELGKLLSANKMLIGTIMSLGKKTVITGRIIDVQKGVGEFSQNQSVQSEEELFSAVSLFAKNLTLRIEGKTPIDDSATSTVKIPKRKPESSGTESADGETKAGVNGKYYDLLQIVYCPQDSQSYGAFYEWGKWSGTSWCGQKVQAGYWIWVDPNWYIWKNKKVEEQ